MMSTATNAPPPIPAAQSTMNAAKTKPEGRSTPVKQKSAQPKPQPTTTDTVQLGSAARAAAQKATEIPAQTAKEASHGDTQAQRLLAKVS